MEVSENKEIKRHTLSDLVSVVMEHCVTGLATLAEQRSATIPTGSLKVCLFISLFSGTSIKSITKYLVP